MNELTPGMGDGVGKPLLRLITMPEVNAVLGVPGASGTPLVGGADVATGDAEGPGSDTVKLVPTGEGAVVVGTGPTGTPTGGAGVTTAEDGETGTRKLTLPTVVNVTAGGKISEVGGGTEKNVGCSSGSVVLEGVVGVPAGGLTGGATADGEGNVLSGFVRDG